MIKKSLFFGIAVAIVAAVLSSCSTPKDVAYFQDFVPGKSIQVQNPVEIKFRADDEIRIHISTREKELSDLFNLYANSGSSGGSMGGQGGGIGSRYTIADDGCIRFPVLGKIHVAGLNRQELQETIREMLMEKELVKDPIVTVDYSNLYVVVLGDAGVGRVLIDRDKFTILDALGSSGDLAITGQRQNVKVIRENYGKKTVYQVNLCSAEDLYSSPVYYLQQNDVIYVEQNDKQKRNATINGNSVATPAFWISIASFLVGILAIK